MNEHDYPYESDHMPSAPEAGQPAPTQDSAPRYSAPQPSAASAQPQYTAPQPQYTAPQPQAQPQYSAPQPQYPPRAQYAAPRPAPKKKKPGVRLAAVAICCALVGSILGGGLVGGLMLYSNRKTVHTEELSEPITPTTEATTPTVAAVSNPDGLMTPAQVYKTYVSAVVGISNESTSYNIFGQATQSASSGSGFIISSDGEILTNYHVVEGAQTLTVSLYDGSQYSARVLGYEAESDVALLKIDASGLPCVSLGDSDSLVVGEEVAAIGNPLGELTYSLTVGYVSSMDRDINTDGTPINMMQIDAAINPGNSGGPLFRMDGTVIGINTAKYSGTTNSGTTIEGIGFAIPINDVLDILDDLRENGAVLDRAYMGVTVQTVAASEAMGTPAGVQVASVTAGSAADNAGLRTGDIITAVDGTTISDPNGLTKALKSYRGGDRARLTVFRNGQSMTVSIVFDSKDSQTTAEPETEPTTEAASEDEGWSYSPWGFLFP